MKKNTVYTLACAGLISFCLLLFTLAVYMGTEVGKESNSQGICGDRPTRIAIFTPTTHPALEEIEAGFKETLAALSGDKKTCQFTTLNANGNRTLLQAQAHEIVMGDYDLVFTIGAGCSQMIAQLMRKKNNKTPHVFSAVDGREYAQSLQDINTDADGKSHSCGVYVEDDYAGEMDVLHALKPGVKNMLLVYDPTHGTGLEKYKDLIVGYNKNRGVTVHAVQVYQANEIQQKVSALLPSMDAVVVLTDNTVVTGIDVLINLCNHYGVTLCASDLASGKKGAAFAYGVTEYESGAGGAHLAHDILMCGKKPQELSPKAAADFRVIINRQTMQAQGLVIAELLLREIEFTGKMPTSVRTNHD
jgi:putative ABC transport system substrate-binding protein